MSRCILGGVVLLCVLAGARPACAQEKRAPRLVFTAPPGCGNEAIFRNTMAIFFDGADPFDSNALDVVRVTFTKIPGGYRGAVQYTPPTGEPWPTEEETGSMCQLIYPTIARLASMHFTEPTPAAPPPTQPEPTTKPPEPKRPAAWVPPLMAPENLHRSNPPPPARKPVDLAIGLSGFVLMSAGYTANVAPGFQLGAEARSAQDESDIFRLGLEARFVVPSIAYAREPLQPTVFVGEPPKPTVLPTIPHELDVSQLSALLVPCVRWKYLLGCAVGQLDVMFIQTKQELASNWSYGFGPRLGLEVPFAERFAFRAFGEALFTPRQAGAAFDRPPPGEEGAPNVRWGKPLVSGFFGAGLAMTFQ